MVIFFPKRHNHCFQRSIRAYGSCTVKPAHKDASMRSCRWLMKIEIANPRIVATVGMNFLGTFRNNFISCVNTIVTGTAITASQKFVCIVGKSIRLTSLYLYIVFSRTITFSSEKVWPTCFVFSTSR